MLGAGRGDEPAGEGRGGKGRTQGRPQPHAGDRVDQRAGDRVAALLLRERPQRIDTTVKVTIAKGTTGYGPMTQTWTVAPGRLAGIIYYQSYGTLLAKNLGGAVGGDKMFGGAVLSIHVGDTGPQAAGDGGAGR